MQQYAIEQIIQLIYESDLSHEELSLIRDKVSALLAQRQHDAAQQSRLPGQQERERQHFINEVVLYGLFKHLPATPEHFAVAGEFLYYSQVEQMSPEEILALALGDTQQ